MKHKAIIFDFDGVIGKSETQRFNFFKELFKNRGYLLPNSEFKNIVGRTSKLFLSNLQLNGLSDDVKNDVLEEYTKEYKGNITKYVYPIDAVVNFIKNYNGTLKLAVGSTADYKILQLLTDHFGILSKFELLTGKEHSTKHKPDPEAYLITAQKLNVHANECIVIEDSLVGAQAAISAGMTCYVFLNGLNNKKDFSNLPLAGFLERSEDFNKLV